MEIRVMNEERPHTHPNIFPIYCMFHPPPLSVTLTFKGFPVEVEKS